MLHKQKPHHDAQDAEYVGLKSVDRFHMLLSCSWRITHRHQHTQTLEMFNYSIGLPWHTPSAFRVETGGVDRDSRG
jgi:hypothetical protein